MRATGGKALWRPNTVEALPDHSLLLNPNASEGRRLSQVGLVSSVFLQAWNELVRL